MSKIRSYTELIKLKSFEERLEYLSLNGFVGKETFGFNRIFNQQFYRSMEWKRICEKIIVRDNGCDLGIDGRFIYRNRVVVHHMNPVSIEDIQNVTDFLLNPEYLITTTHATHNQIHYGVKLTIPSLSLERKPNDTCLWKK